MTNEFDDNFRVSLNNDPKKHNLKCEKDLPEFNWNGPSIYCYNNTIYEYSLEKMVDPSMNGLYKNSWFLHDYSY